MKAGITMATTLFASGMTIAQVPNFDHDRLGLALPFPHSYQPFPAAHSA